jgi:hypothetical protein
MKWMDALKIGLELLAKFELAQETGVEVPVNWSKRVGHWRLRLKGFVTAERAL